MENKYFRNDVNPITRQGTVRINYGTLDNDFQSLKRVLETREDYIAWVKEWRIMHAFIVHDIKHYRFLKNRIKYDVAFANTTSDNCNMMQNRKKFFGAVAHEMYQMRNENKAWVKTLKTPRVEAA